MTTLLRADGQRCDARCHEGDPSSTCTCVCGGRYHGLTSTERASAKLAADLAAHNLPEHLEQLALDTAARRAGYRERVERECGAPGCETVVVEPLRYCCRDHRLDARNARARARTVHRKQYAHLLDAHELEAAGQLVDVEVFGELPPVPALQVPA